MAHPENVHELAENHGFYALAMWAAEDVLAARTRKGLPSVSEDVATEWLKKSCSAIQDAMVAAGWDAIDTLLDASPIPGAAA